MLLDLGGEYSKRVNPWLPRLLTAGDSYWTDSSSVDRENRPFPCHNIFTEQRAVVKKSLVPGAFATFGLVYSKLLRVSSLNNGSITGVQARFSLILG